MSYLDKLHFGKKGGVVHAVTSEVVGAGVYAGASYGFGYVQNRYRDKASLWGVPVDLLAGVGLTAATIGCDLYVGHGKWGKRIHNLTPITRDVGRAGFGAYFHTLGAASGAAKSGVKRLLISEADLPKAKAALPNATVLGDIPKAPHGDSLSARDLAEMAK